MDQLSRRLSGMRRVAVLFVIASVAVSQHDSALLASSASVAALQWAKGFIEGRTYKNPSLGIEFTPAPGLEFGDVPELKGKPGAVPLIVTITATRSGHPFEPTEVMAFYADALAYYPPGQRSSDSYVRKVITANKKEGFEPLRESSEGQLSRVVFARQDFVKGPVYEEVLVKTCKAEALVFIFTGASRDETSKLIAATRLKLDFARSGCSR